MEYDNFLSEIVQCLEEGGTKFEFSVSSSREAYEKAQDLNAAVEDFQRISGTAMRSVVFSVDGKKIIMEVKS